ncbi:Phosphoribosylformylglycinamidine synthase subunit PurL [Candidatus Methanoperedenaceae archaeon GB50]|nr:Phosphoribosylformylglycinamidine synthase subunit PurL [Candidatus Methanoperedenaceae archaeon GB50]
MAAKGDLGMVIDLDRVHLRVEGLTAFEILIAESQERMVLEVKPENVEKVLMIAEKYDLDASVIGELTRDKNYTVLHRGANRCRYPCASLVRRCTHERETIKTASPI